LQGFLWAFRFDIHDLKTSRAFHQAHNDYHCRLRHLYARLSRHLVRGLSLTFFLASFSSILDQELVIGKGITKLPIGKGITNTMEQETVMTKFSQR
jgi:hypothetical protein